VELVLVDIIQMEHYLHNVFVFKDLPEIIVKVNKKEEILIINWISGFDFLATLCSPTSCNGGLCRAIQNSIVCVCPAGKVGDRCQVIFIFV
jgi:hypothetical protein